MEIKFKDWYDKKLIVSRFPMPTEILNSDFDIYINVSDEYIESCYLSAIKSGKMYFWFPMNECTNDIGLNSIYASMQILKNAEDNNKKVYLHCHAGVNRSPTVKECYYLMRTGDFEVKSNSRLMENIRSGHLPSENKIKSLFNNFNNAFLLDETNRGGQLDSCKLKSRC